MIRTCLASVAIGLVGCFFVGPPTSAQDPPAGKPAAKEIVVQAEFRSAIEISTLRRALRESSPAGLSAAALKLLAAEKKLGRSHAPLSGNALLKVAIRAVTEAHDVQALDRLAAGLQQLEMKQEHADLVALHPLLAKSRRVFAGPDLSPQETTPEAIVLFNSIRKQIIAAKVIGNRESVEDLKKTAVSLAQLHSKQRGYLLKLADDSLAVMAPKSDSGSETLVALAAGDN